ncbi:hypothetical protein BDB00DRAFT_799457 [Zychaea mexicana]|uniref:uncharacterized protein n=1 Tax=Zychaea mexicana TaxID=64656 RepID=UPI0022FEBBC0|nr:uncharacterized protein BDB00DRAFT_799457 [Zychaea mexicana]KAI9498767.1 hypothetical protein BDB00DRAFT_799457 [Zychaea mexicana]
MTISSHVKLAYFDIGTNGFGEYVKLLLQDSGVSHDYERIPLDPEEWSAKKEELKKSRALPFGTLPYVEIEGRYYGGSTPLLRLLSKKLGKYRGSGSDDDEYFLDAATDLCLDWRNAANKVLFAKKTNGDVVKAKEYYVQTDAVKHYGRFDEAYSLHDGPYLLGQEISYPEFLVYHIIYNDGRTKQGLDKYPNLARFIKAFEERTNLKEYVTTLPESPSFAT